jgi:protein-S-isoprenylcysteine O-methyltransferase Ste14
MIAFSDDCPRKSLVERVGGMETHFLHESNSQVSMFRWVYRYRGYLVTPPLIFALVWFRWEIEASFVWPLGVILLLIGVLIRVWAQQHLHYGLKVRKKLTTTGPYSFVRNPMYIGNILICLGASVLSELQWFVPVTFFCYFGIYSFVVRYEEAHLLEKYRERYQKYMSEVPRWLPKGLRLKNLSLMNEYLNQTIAVEIQSLLLLFPFLLKEIIDKSMD